MNVRIILMVVLIFQTALAMAATPAQLAIAKVPEGVPLSQRYQVRLRPVGTDSWQDAPVYSFFKQHDYNWALTTESQFVTFDATGNIEVEVTVAGQAKTPVLRPLIRKIAVQQEGATLRFTMGDTARQLCLELNSDPRHPLVLFSNPPETDVPKADDPKVTYFGPGYHKAGPIKSSGSGKTIYLAPGAVVEGALAISEGDGVTVRGRGILFNPYPEDGKGHRTPLNIYASKNVCLEGIVLLNRADSWTFRSVASRGVTIENFHLLSEIRDGLDIINSQEVKVRDSFFMAHDDAICMKGLAGEGKNQPVEDVHVEHCVLANMAGGNGIEIGYESVTPVYQRLTFQNIDIIYSLPNGDAPDPYWPEAALSIHPTQMQEYGSPEYMGAMPPVRDVTYRNIRIESCLDDFFFDIRPNRNSPGKGIENVLLENISITDSPFRPSRVVGLTDHPVRNVTYKNLDILGQVITNAQQGHLTVENADCHFISPVGATPQASSGHETTVHPREIDDPLVNPYCGWGIWAGPRFFDSRQFSPDYNTKGFGDDAPLFSWVLIDWMWSDLEPKEGQFDWKDLDAVVDYWKARNKQLVVRLRVTTDPGWAGAPGNKVCPDWLWNAGVKYHEYKAEGGVKQKCPDYADPTWETLYLPKMKRFLTAYRDRYHKPGHSIVLDHVMGFGDWGEWHTMWSHYPWPSREKKREVLIKAINAYLDVFAPSQPDKDPVRNLVIAQVYDDDCGGDVRLDDALHRQALDVAAAKGLAFTRNGFIDGLSGWPNDLMDRYWRDHQLIGEGNWSYEQVKRDKTHGTMAEHVDAFTRFHSTYAHQYMQSASYRQAMSDDREQFERGLRAGGIGYRFVLSTASWETTRNPGQTLKLRQEWVNRNASWCVYPYRLKLYLVDRDGKDAWSGVDRGFDPRSWLCGSTYSVVSEFQLPEYLKAGTYDLRVALVDESGMPGVQLGISDGDTARRYRLGSVTVTQARRTGQVPVVFKVSEGVRPNSVVSLYGEFLSGSPSIRFLKTDGSVAATQASVQTDPGGHFCRVIFPSIPPGAYKLSVQNEAGWSAQAILVNRAEPRWISEERAYPGLQLKLIGRNLDASEYNGAGNTLIRLMPVQGGDATLIPPDAVNPYCVDFSVPSRLAAGDYFVEVTTGSAEFGKEWVRLNNHSEFPDTPRDTLVKVERAPVNPTALALKVAWASDFNWSNVVDVKRDLQARGDGSTDDTQAIQSAIDRTAESGGGVIHIPNGVYKVDHLVIASGCILQGVNAQQTIIEALRTGGDAITTKGSRHGLSNITLRYQREARDDIQSTLIGGDANKLFLCGVTFDLLRNPDISVQHSPYYVSGAGPMLVTECRFFISSRNLWNHSVRNRVTFRDNFIDMHDGLGLCMSSEKLLVLNNELVFHPATYAGQMNGFFLNEGWMGWNIYNAYIGGNNAHDLNGPGDCQPFAADSAWSCVAGAVISASSNTVDVRAEVNGDLKNLESRELEVVVVQGKGLGQLRRMSAQRNLGGNPAVIRFTVSPPWDVPPDTTSVVSAGSWHVNNVFHRNTAHSTKSPYNMYYGGSYDCVDADAISENSEGWYNWGRIGEFTNTAWHCPVYFSQLKRSSFSGISPAYGTMGITLRVENETVNYRGIGDYGTEIRDNTIDRGACPDKNQRLAGNAAIATFNQSWMKMTTNTPLILATLCEGNKIMNSSVGFDLDKTFSFAIRGTIYENCPKSVNDNGCETALLPGTPDLLKSPVSKNQQGLTSEEGNN